jgi:NADH-quinone oxidoreductase subunit L
MFIGLGSGAFAAGVFHLMTHAFFKSLLFLAAGAVIHALSGEQDMRKMGGLRTRIPAAYRVFLVGALALSGVPGLSGFFSKDEILAAAWASGNRLVWGLGLLAAGLTAFYIFRLIFLTFFGRERTDRETADPIHESPAVMRIPLAVLAALAAVGGYLGLPRVLGGGAWLGRFLASSLGGHEAHLTPGSEILLMAVSTAVALAGIGLAYVVYIRRDGAPARRLAERLPGLYKIVAGQYFVDEAYEKVFVGGALALGRAAAWFDARILDRIVNGVAGAARVVSRLAIGFDGGIIDGAVNGVGRVFGLLSAGLRRLQTGYVSNYALAVVFGLVVILSLVVTVL